MAAIPNIDIKFEFEPIVKLACRAIECRFNLVNAATRTEDRQAACNLKQITIGSGGQCKEYEPKGDK